MTVNPNKLPGRVLPAPPEVELDYRGIQVLAKQPSGQPFRQYLLCSGGCGYVIGCGDAIEEVYHNSCAPRGFEPQ